MSDAGWFVAVALGVAALVSCAGVGGLAAAEGLLSVETVVALLPRPCEACVTLAVPVRRVEPGEVLTAADLRFVDLPPEYVPATAVPMAAGRTAALPLYEGQLVLAGRLR